MVSAACAPGTVAAPSAAMHAAMMVRRLKEIMMRPFVLSQLWLRGKWKRSRHDLCKGYAIAAKETLFCRQSWLSIRGNRLLAPAGRL
jgi:hypothetical protein